MSASGIKKHADCPKSWWFRYESDVEPIEGDTTHLDLGNAVHDALEDALKGWMLNDRNLESYAKMRYESRADHHGVEDADIWKTGRDCIETAVEYVLDRDPDIIGIEDDVEFDVNRPDLNETFKGKMDVATQSEIWDWKTGSIRDDTRKKERIQGAVYMAAYRAEYGKPPEKVRFVYLKEEKVRSFEPSDEVWHEMLGAARSLAASKRADEWPAKPGDQCYWCPYEQSCAEAGGIGVGFDWDAWVKL